MFLFCCSSLPLLLKDSISMAANNCNGREHNFWRPLYVLEDPSLASPSHPANFLGVPLTSLDTTVQVDHEEASRIVDELYGDKILISFKNNCLSEEDVNIAHILQ